MNQEPQETAWTGGRVAGRCAARAGESCDENNGFAPMYGGQQRAGKSQPEAVEARQAPIEMPCL